MDAYVWACVCACMRLCMCVNVCVYVSWNMLKYMLFHPFIVYALRYVGLMTVLAD